MNQPTANSCLINNSSPPGELLSLAAPSKPEDVLTETPRPKRRNRKPKALAKATLAEPERCRHYTSNGRRCRLAVLDPASGLCFRHVGRQFPGSGDEDLSPAFLGLLSGFQSASRIHAFLTQLTVLLVQNRISSRRAAVLAYLGQLLLRTLPAIDKQEKAAEDPQPSVDAPFPPHLQEIIDNKRRFALQRYAETINRGVNSKPEERGG